MASVLTFICTFAADFIDTDSLVELHTPRLFMVQNKVSKRVTATILSMSLLTVMAGAAIAPALGIIKAHFSEADALLVQLIVSMPALLMMIFFVFPTNFAVIASQQTALSSEAITMIMVGLDVVAFFVGLVFLVQVFATRHFQSLPPAEKR